MYAGAVLAALAIVLALAVLGQDDEADPQADGGAPAAVPEPGEAGPAACAAEQPQPDLGGGHLEMTPDALAPNPPSVLYPSEPPTSGPHVGQVVASGAYAGQIDPRITTHNLEHGYIVAWFDTDAPQDTIGPLLAWAFREVEFGGRKVVAAGYPGTFPDGADIAFTAWGVSQLCDGFDQEAADAFARSNHDILGAAPERGIPAHEPEDPGVVVPDPEDDLLLPPLD